MYLTGVSHLLKLLGSNKIGWQSKLRGVQSYNVSYLKYFMVDPWSSPYEMMTETACVVFIFPRFHLTFFNIPDKNHILFLLPTCCISESNHFVLIPYCLLSKCKVNSYQIMIYYNTEWQKNDKNDKNGQVWQNIVIVLNLHEVDSLCFSPHCCV